MNGIILLRIMDISKIILKKRGDESTIVVDTSEQDTSKD